MNGERRERRMERYERGRAVTASQGSADSVLGRVWIVIVLVALSVLAGPSLAGRAEAHVECPECGNAADPIQYEFMVTGEPSSRLAVGDVADPVQYEFMVRPVGRLTVGDVSDPIQYEFMVRPAGRLTVDHVGDPVQYEFLVGPAGQLTVGDASDPIQYTSLVALAEAAQARARSGESARLTGLAEHYLSGQSRQECAESYAQTRRSSAEAARLHGLAEWNGMDGVTAVEEPGLGRAQAAAAARLSGLASHLGVGPTIVSPLLACAIGL